MKIKIVLVFLYKNYLAGETVTRTKSCVAIAEQSAIGGDGCVIIKK